MADKFVPAVNQTRWSQLQPMPKDRWIEDLRNALPLFRAFDETITPTSVGADTVDDQSFTFTGVESNDTIIGFKTAGGTIGTIGLGIFHHYVSAANTINIIFENETAGALTPTSQLYTFIIMRTPA